MLQFRAMTRQDLPAVIRIETGASSHPWKEKHYLDSLNSGHICLVAEVDQQIVAQGVTMTVADEASLLILTVAREHQGRGYGKALLEHLGELASATCSTMFLEVRASNDAAFNLYLNVGFSEVGRRPNYYPASGSHKAEDAIVMVQDLSFL